MMCINEYIFNTCVIGANIVWILSMCSFGFISYIHDYLF